MKITERVTVFVILGVLVGCVGCLPKGRTRAELDPGDPTPPALTISTTNSASSNWTYSPDGKLLAAAAMNANGTIRIVNSETGEQTLLIQSHSRPIRGLAFSPDGSRLISASDDGTVKFWHPESGELARTIDAGFPIASLALSRRGDRIACGGYSKWSDGIVDPETGILGQGSRSSSIRIWDAESAELITEITIRDTGGLARKLAFGHDGQQLATGGPNGVNGAQFGDHPVTVWKVPEGTLLRELKGHKKPITSVVYSPDGLQIATGSVDRRVKIWSTETGEEITTLGHEDVIGCVDAIAFSPGGTQLATASGFGVHVWDLATKKRVRTLKDLTRGEVHLKPGYMHGIGTSSDESSEVVFSPDGRYVAGKFKFPGKLVIWKTSPQNTD